MGVFAVGDRVVVVSTAPRADGLQAGTRGVVSAYVVAAGAGHQEIHMRRKGGRVSMFAPCELRAGDPPPATTHEYLSHEEFVVLLRQRRIGHYRVVSLSIVELESNRQRIGS